MGNYPDFSLKMAHRGNTGVHRGKRELFCMLGVGLAFQGGGGQAALTDGAGLSLASSGPLVVCAQGQVRLDAAAGSASTPHDF